ncbi:PXMP2/4 family protein 4-like [Vigna radiata var. radiata]|uniref:PXMP2/4 family protein 4-like n=1 Tax=Vigna radiata var. radiata TaxID=3916 RepID=A0A3Q0EVS3_VIGRR|nr:PXMP2/4 family protein 4-like [Vigna radiata var. radiata]
MTNAISNRFFVSLSTPPNHFLVPPLSHFRRFHRPHLYRKPPLHERASRSVTRFSSVSSSSYSGKPGFVGWYLRMLETYPLIIKSVTSSLVFAASDITSQVTPFCASYDLIRTLRMAIYGLLILGPTQHTWFGFLSKIFPKTDLASTLKKILMGQLILGPIINAVFFSYNGACQGEGGTQIMARLKRDLLPTLLSGALYWPVCDFVTLRYLPVRLQPLLNSTFTYVWTIFLTYMANRG